MCGICGLRGAPQPRVVAEMLRLLEHRGPDDEGVFSTPAATLAARRLAIIDVANGRQPALNEDGTVVAVLNGEIYNYRELRALLERRGHRLRSGSDTEVLPHLYEEFGAGLPSLLRGMFALAIWDARAGRLLLARDRAGEKPLLYTRLPDGELLFASELKALLAHPHVRRAIDPVALRLYLQLHYIPGERTIVDGVSRLPAGHRLVADEDGVQVERYWDLAPSHEAYFVSPDGAVEELRMLLRDAVSMQLHADREVGALLSGGIDSTGIVALMKDVGGAPPRTFTVGFADADFDERAPARAAAAAIGTDHTELLVGPPTFEDLERLIWHLDEPVADQAALPTYLIEKVASEHVTVVLTGEGSDELFGGYPRYGWYELAGRIDAAPAALRKAAARAAAHAGRGREGDLLLSPRTPLERHLAWTHVFGVGAVDELLGAEGRNEALAYVESLVNGRVGSPLETAMYLDFKTWLVDDILTRADRMSMAWSLEARAPYLDAPLLEFVSSIPSERRVGLRTTKPLLRRALAGIVPPELLGRTKHAFRPPVERWLHESLAAPVAELLLAGDAKTADLLDRNAVSQALGTRGREAGLRAWTLVVLELWLRTVFAQPAVAA